MSKTNYDTASTPGTILVAITGNLACWFLTGIIAYISPASSFQDDKTILGLFLWMLQATATIFLVLAVETQGWWSTPAATLTAAIVGASTTLVYGIWNKWGNVATYAFWMAAGIYVALGLEAKFRVAAALERRIGTLLE